MAPRDSPAAKMPRPGSRAGRRAPPIEYRTLALRCPVCHAEINAEVPDSVSPHARETDLRPLFASLDPLPWFIHACPSCRYTAYREGYEGRRMDWDEVESQVPLKVGDRPPPGRFLPDELELDDLRRWLRRGELVRGVTEGCEPFGAERYVLGARCYEFLRDSDGLGIADYYLRASWCARACGDPELERACQREAVNRLQGPQEAGRVPEPEKVRVLYLIAELSRRSGAFGQAVNAFSQLESMVDVDDAEGALFAHLAKRQLSLAVVKSDINAVIAEDEIGLEREDE